MHTNFQFSIQHIKEALKNKKNGGSEKKYEALYNAIKSCILKKHLPNNSILPTSRLLATELNLSRSTINKAYDLLKVEHLINSQQGSGFTICYEEKVEAIVAPMEIANYPAISETGSHYAANVSLLNRMPNENMAFRPGLPPLDAFPVNQWKRLLNNYWKHVKSSSLNYSLSTGLTELKMSVSNYLNVSRNIQCDPEQIVIVSGSVQSLYLVSNALINKGDRVVLEDPVFPNVHSIFKSAQAVIHPARMDHEGIDLKSLDYFSQSPKLIHVTPNNQYPTGIKMSLKRRKEVLAFATEHNALIIENDYENEIANFSQHTPSIFSLDKESRTIYMGTFNRLLHPSIRLGYMIVPPYLKEVIRALMEHSQRFVTPSIQVVMNEFINKNYLFQHLNNSIAIAKARHDLFISEFEKASRLMHIKNKNFSSFHLIAHFNQNISVSQERAFIEQLRLKNITAFSLSKCYISSPKQQGFVLGYSSVRSNLLIRKVEQMGKII